MSAALRLAKEIQAIAPVSAKDAVRMANQWVGLERKILEKAGRMGIDPAAFHQRIAYLTERSLWDPQYGERLCDIRE